MDPDSICYSEKLTFLKYINPRILFYFITLLVFAGIFLLTWILNKYTYFEKLKIPRGSIPKFPYGNFRDVVSHKTSLHEFAWKNYNRFKKKNLKYGGLFIFTKPVILVTDKSAVMQLTKLNNPLYKGVVPRQVNVLDYSKANRFFSDLNMNTYFENHKNSIKGLFLENLQKDDFFSVLRNCLLETVCLVFGLKSCEMVDEINELLQEKSDTSFRNFLSLAYPIFQKSRKSLRADLKEIFLEILNDRKKNDVKKEDLIETFIDLYNESQQCELEELTSEIFDVFGDALIYSYSSSLFCIHELARNKEIQDDVIGEVRRFNRKNVGLGSTEDLDYLDAVIKETLRKYPPIATVIKSISSTSNDVGFQLPKDALMLVSVLACHRDANNYTDPDTFDPDRFSEEVRPTKQNTFLPFGISPRSYIDKQLTILILKLMLHGIFSSYRVTLDTSSNLKVNPMLLYLSPCEDFRFKFNLL